MPSVTGGHSNLERGSMITLCNKEEAPRLAPDFDFVISILDKNFRWPHNFGDNHLVVRFEDTENPTEREHNDQFFGVNQILNWLKNKRVTSDHKLLVHCHAGISRSSAISWLILTTQGVEPKEAFQTLFKARPLIWPNMNIMMIGDQLLGKEGELIKLAREVDEEISDNRRTIFGY